MSRASASPRVLFAAGYIAMLVGAIDPLEGSIVILAGSSMILLGAYFEHGERQYLVYRFRVYVPVVLGIAALWITSMLGGFGGSSGLSVWWGLLVFAYPVGWLLNIWAPDSPRWALWLGAVVGFWYLILPIVLVGVKDNVRFEDLGAPEIIMAVFGVLTITGCIYRLSRQKHLQVMESRF